MLQTIESMNTKLDLKSGLIGLGIGVLAMLAIGAAEPQHPMGRFQVGGGSGTFIIVDTTTGQAWGANNAIHGAQPGFWEAKVR